MDTDEHGLRGGAGKSGGGPPRSKTWRMFGAARQTRSVLECASPLALWQARDTTIAIPNAAGATGRVARPVKYGGDNGKPWRGALFHRARRTKLGEDGNQIGAHSALCNSKFDIRNSQLSRLFSGFHFGMLLKFSIKIVLP